MLPSLRQARVFANLGRDFLGDALIRSATEPTVSVTIIARPPRPPSWFSKLQRFAGGPGSLLIVERLAAKFL